jgi:hypothetical protein
LEFIDSILADNKGLVPVAKRTEGGVGSPNPMKSVLKAANKLPVSTLLLSRSNPVVCVNQILSSGK